jgi:hypothetical protein
MYFIALYIEILRRRPVIVFWLAALAQAVLWTLVPTLFYAAPPGDVANVLAVGHEFVFGTDFGPPLAFWLAEVAYRIVGGRMFGVYLLSQICLVVTYWSVFALGSAVVGRSHAAVAVLLMVGISAFTVATPEFGPPILTMALWALMLLHLWRAVGEGRSRYWFALAAEGALLLFTTYQALAFIGLIVLFVLASERGRASLGTIHPWIAAGVIVAALFPHALWLESSRDFLLPTVARLFSADAADNNLIAWLRQVGWLVLAHAGLAVLVVLALGLPWSRRGQAGTISRPAVVPFAHTYVYFFALMPAIVSTAFAVIAGWPATSAGMGALLVLSGLAVVVAAGDVIAIYYQRMVGFAWVFLLLAPAAMAAAAVAVIPWTRFGDLKITQPAGEIGRYFGDSFERRMGRPLAVVAGDPRLASLIAAAAPSRPSLYLDETPERTPWVSAESIKEKGAVIVWPATDTVGTPPADIKFRFPDLVPEVPRAFERPFQGILPLVRIGWAMIRPQAPLAPPAPATPAEALPKALERSQERVPAIVPAPPPTVEPEPAVPEEPPPAPVEGIPLPRPRPTR